MKQGDNFFKFYRQLLAYSLKEFIKKYPTHRKKNNILNSIDILLDFDYEGEELCELFNHYSNIETDLSEGGMENPSDWDYNIHDSIIDYLCNHFGVNLNEDEYDEITNFGVESELLKSFIKELDDV